MEAHDAALIAPAPVVPTPAVAAATATRTAVAGFLFDTAIAAHGRHNLMSCPLLFGGYG